MEIRAPSAEALGELLNDAYYIVDSDDKIVSHNPAFEDLLGRPAVDALRNGSSRCFETAFLPCRGDRCLRERCAVEGMVRLDKIEIYAPDAKGQPEALQLSVIAGPVALPTGERGTIIILRDVGEMRTEAMYQAAVQDQLDQAQRYMAVAQQGERQRREMAAQVVAGVTHEMNTPLGVANAASASMWGRFENGTLKELAETPETLEDYEELQLGAELIERNLLRADKLLRKLKRHSAGQMVDTREELDLGRSFGEVLQFWSSEPSRADFQVEVVDQLTPGLFWEGYAGLFTQVVLELLLSNVERHAYPGGKGGKIEVKMSSVERTPPEYRLSVRDFGRPHWRATSHPASVPRFRISVRDFGKGVSQDVLPTTLDEFFSTGNPAVVGGLLIVRYIVEERFGGTLECHSQPGAGATFTASFSHCAAADRR